MLWAGVEICYYGSKCYRCGFECYRQVWKPAAMAPSVTGICGNWVGLALSVTGRWETCHYGFRFCSSCSNTAVTAPSNASGCIHNRFSSLVVSCSCGWSTLHLNALGVSWYMQVFTDKFNTPPHGQLCAVFRGRSPLLAGGCGYAGSSSWLKIVPHATRQCITTLYCSLGALSGVTVLS